MFVRSVKQEKSSWKAKMGNDNSLTQRQIEVMNLVKLGYANKQISRELGIAMGTVERCLYDIYHRLQADGRAHAVYLCMKEGIID